MQSLSRWALALVVSTPAAGLQAAEPGAARPDAAPSAEAAPRGDRPEPDCPPEALEEERAFDAALARYQRLAEFTQKLVEDRERRAFEEASERYARFAELTERLARQAEEQAEREFEAELELYLRKRELTQRLSAHARAAPKKPLPAAPQAPSP